MSPRSVAGGKFRVTLGYMREYIKHVGDSVDLVFINDFDSTQKYKTELRHSE